MTVIDWISVALAIASIPALILVIRTGHGERLEEDAARAYFDEHGRWPEDERDGAAKESNLPADAERRPPGF